MPLVVLEGPDKSGKTTQALLLHNRLLQEGFRVFSFREPGGTELGEKLREILFSEQVSPEVAATLLAASRRHLMDTKIMPALADKENVVILDRFYYSQLVYQQGAKFNYELATFSAMHYANDLRIGLLPVTEEVDTDTVIPGTPGAAEITKRYKELYEDYDFFCPRSTKVADIHEEVYEKFLSVWLTVK